MIAPKSQVTTLSKHTVTPDIHIVHYLSDNSGYGLEIIGDDIGYSDFSFGDDSVEAYAVSAGVFDMMNQVLLDRNVSDAYLDLADTYPANAALSIVNTKRLSLILENIVRWTGHNPLNPIHLGQLRASLDMPNHNPPIWAEQIRGKY